MIFCVLLICCSINSYVASDQEKVDLKSLSHSITNDDIDNIVSSSPKIYSHNTSPLNLPIPVGKEVGITSNNIENQVISQHVFQKILQGVETKNKESIYYYGLLKLYGITITPSISEAARYFLEAAELGHLEAMTAYAVLYLPPSDSKFNQTQTTNHETDENNFAMKTITKNLEYSDTNITNNRIIGDIEKSIYWFKRAAVSGDINAHWLLAK